MKSLKLVVYGILFFSWLAASAPAALTINVDKIAQEYYLSGSATGLPFSDFRMNRYIFWDNRQATNNDGNYTNFLSIDAFLVSGNTATSFTMFQHANGDINGALRLTSAATATLSGNSARRYSYAAFSPGLISDLEGKAADGEILPATSGSTNFNMQFVAVPEPSSIVLVVLGAAFLLKTVRFGRRA